MFHPAVFNVTMTDSSFATQNASNAAIFVSSRVPHAPNIPNPFNSQTTHNVPKSFAGTTNQNYFYDDEEEFAPQQPLLTHYEDANRGTPSPFTVPTFTNATVLQLPVLWTALSLALGLEVQGEIIRGLPCIKRQNQLFCRSAGNSYPTSRIASFIDDNKALMRRMYGHFLKNSAARDVSAEVLDTLIREDRSADEAFYPPPPEDFEYHSDDPRGSAFMELVRAKRQTLPGALPSSSDRVDSCESKMEIVTPFWASNSGGKIRAIVNTQEFGQAIQQEVCAKQTTKRCTGDCQCEQKYKWHRMLSYDPEDDCRGIFMDWFLFPSCCVCRCSPLLP